MIVQFTHDDVIDRASRFNESRDQQKIYADSHITKININIGDNVFLPIRIHKSIIKLGKGFQMFFGSIKQFENPCGCQTSHIATHITKTNLH